MIFCSFEATEKEYEKNEVIESQTREWKKEETSSSEEKIHNYVSDLFQYHRDLSRKHKFDYLLTRNVKS